MFYFVKTPWLVKKYVYPAYVWEMPRNENKLYLTFDDGPHPVATHFVLDELKKFGAKGSFFCIGKNVAAHPDIYQRIILEGHAVGNHTQDHLNGWEINDETYFKNISTAAKYVDSSLFRPPYGRITRFQAKQVMDRLGLKIIMWSILSGDFDLGMTAEDCWNNVRKATHPGAIIVFHDSEKALKKLQYVLPRVLEFFSQKRFSFNRIEI